MQRTKILCFLFMLTFIGNCSTGYVKKTSLPESTAYDFTLPNQNGKSIQLSHVLKNYRGAVIAFYPKDDTKKWIEEFVEFQQNIKKYQERNIKILGISRDSAESHRDFIKKHGLNDMTLLVDKKGRIAKLYGTDHWLLPVARRVYIIVDKNRNIIYKKDMGFALLENQTETLIQEIDKHLR